MRVQPRRVFAASVVVIASASAAPAKKPPVKAPPPRPEAHWHVFQQDKRCLVEAVNPDACKVAPGETARPCNPPPPTPYKCSAANGEPRPFNIVRYAGEKECFVEREPVSCPAGVSCNPPPPKKVGCP